MKNILSTVILVLVLMFSYNAFADGDNAPAINNAKASISGKVLDISTGEALAGVAISIEGTNIKAYTDLDGSFSVEGITPGNYNLILSLISYKKSLVENIKLNPSEKEVVNVKLDAVR